MAQGIIILDGPDGTGKSTLAQYYIKKYNARYLHLTYRFKNNMFEYNTAAIELAARWANQGHLVIIDRLWMSELVYAKVFRGGCKQAFYGRFIDRLVLRYSGIYVLCLPESSREYLSHYETLKTLRDEQYESMLHVYNEYKKLWNKCGLECWPHIFRYDMFVDGLAMEDYAEWILEKLRAEREQGFMLEPTHKNFSGSLSHGEVLFIDAEPIIRHGRAYYPRHKYEDGSVHLTATLELAGIPEYKLMWTDLTGPWKDLTSKYELQPIALGHQTYRGIVKDADHYHYYGKPDCHITPEQDLDSHGQTTFMQRMIHQIQRYITMEK